MGAKRTGGSKEELGKEDKGSVPRDLRTRYQSLGGKSGLGYQW